MNALTIKFMQETGASEVVANEYLSKHAYYDDAVAAWWNE